MLQEKRSPYSQMLSRDIATPSKGHPHVHRTGHLGPSWALSVQGREGRGLQVPDLQVPGEEMPVLRGKVT